MNRDQEPDAIYHPNKQSNNSHADADARFELLLDAYQGAVAEGQSDAEFFHAVGDLPESLRERLALAGRCVRQLHAAWHPASSETRSVISDKTPAPGLLGEPGEIPEHFGRFRIDRELGRGGAGVVWLATDPALGRQVAIKVPLPEMLVTRDLRQRFLREAEAAARLSHPHVVPVYEVGEIGPVCYIALEYCAGGDLASWLRYHGPRMEARRAAALVADLTDAVDHAHRQGVLHRDLKPSNVLLTRSSKEANGHAPTSGLDGYTAKVADFGLAKIMDQAGDATRTGAVLGTTQYMAPEQAEGRTREIAATTDVYALGAILYQLLTGRPPHEGVTDREILSKVLFTEPAPPRRTDRQIPADLEAICVRCLEKRPNDRYATAGRLADDLRRYLTGQETLARPLRPTQRLAKSIRRRPMIAGLAALLIAAVGTIVVGTMVYNARLRISERQAREYAYGADLKLSQQAWDQSAPLEARRLLSRYIPGEGEEDLRRFEWYWLWKRIEQDSIVVAHQPTPVWSLAVSTNSKWFATGDRHGVIRLWDRERRALLRELRGHRPGDIDRLVFAPDGEHLVSAGNDHTIRWWDVKTGENKQEWSEHTDWVGALALSPDGHWIASGAGEGRVLLWNVATRSLERELYRHPGAVRWVVFHPTEPWLVSACEKGEVRIWDIVNNVPPERFSEGKLPVPENPHGPSWRNAVFRWDGLRLFAGDRDQIYEWDLREGLPAKKVFNSVDCFTDRVFSLDVIPAFGLLVEAGENLPTLMTRRCDSLSRAVQSLRGHSDAIRCLAALPDGATLLSGSEDGDVRQWDFTQADPDGREIALPGKPYDLAWSPRSDRLWVATDSHQICVIDQLERPKVRQRGTIFGDTHWIVSFGDNGHAIGIDQIGAIYRGESSLGSSVSFTIPADTLKPALDETGRWLAYRVPNGVVLADTHTGRTCWTKDLKAVVSRIIFCPDGSLAVGCESGFVYRLALADGRILCQSPPQRNSVDWIDASIDGQRLVTASSDKTVRILEAATLQELHRFSHSDTPRRVWFIDNDERLLVFGLSDLSVVNPRTGQDLLKLKRDRFREVDVSPDGLWLAVGRDKAVWLKRLKDY